MKTAKEAAQEYTFSRKDCHSNYHDVNIDILGFNAGIEFAQRWYDVNDELPERYSNQLCLVKYLNKNKNEVIKLARYFENPYSNYNWVIEGSCPRDITHWRPINIQ